MCPTVGIPMLPKSCFVKNWSNEVLTPERGNDTSNFRREKTYFLHSPFSHYLLVPSLKIILGKTGKKNSPAEKIDIPRGFCITIFPITINFRLGTSKQCKKRLICEKQRDRSGYLDSTISLVSIIITKTCPCYEDPLTPHL